MILACASIQNPDYVPTTYQTFLLTIMLMLIHGCMASLPTRWIARVNAAGSTFNIIALIVVIIIIPAATNRVAQGLPRFAPSSVVWGTIYEGTDFPPGVSVLMSFIGVIWTMSGYDSPFRMCVTDTRLTIRADHHTQTFPRNVPTLTLPLRVRSS